MASITHDAHPHQSECSQCRQLFTEPKLLPCGHLVCQQCLLAWMKSQNQAHCPLCHDSVVDCETSEPKTFEEIASDLPTDLSMEDAVWADYLLSQKHHCRVCEDVVASSICLTCGDILCVACKKAHTKLSALRHHIVQDLSALTREKLAASRPATCASHPEETPRLFCPTHGESVCLLCVTSAHKDCQEGEDLEKKMEEAQDILTELAATLSAGEVELQQAIDELDQHLHLTEQRMKSAIADIERMCERLQLAAKENGRRLKELMMKAFSDVKEAVTEGKRYLLHRQAKLKSHNHVVHRVQGMKTYDDVHIMTSVMETRTHGLDYSVTLPSDAKVISTLTFSMDPEAVSHIEQAMSQLGHIKVIPIDIFEKQLPEFRFHERHGSNIVVSQDGKTAERRQSRSDNAIVLSTDPLQSDVLYEVRVDKWENTYVEGSMCVGVITQSPHTLPSLPAWSGHLRSSAIVVRRNWVKNGVTGSQVTSGYGSALASLRVGSRVGVMLDSTRCLHVYVDGEDLGVAARHVPRPCYALFDVCDDAKMVSTMVVRRV